MTDYVKYFSNGLLESDGLLAEATTLHCAVAKNLESGEIVSFTPRTGFEGLLNLLEKATLLVGHNLIGFDLPLLKKLYPSFNPSAEIRDTLVMARLMMPDTLEHDIRHKLPPKLQRKHSLEAWGHRLGSPKGAHTDFSIYSEEMLTYCVQDVEVTHRLWKHLTVHPWPEDSIALEHEIAKIICAQEHHGFCFDGEAAAAFYADLVNRRERLTSELQEAFKPWWGNESTFVPKRDNGRLGYKEGVPVQKGKWIVFNPSSRDHIADRLKTLYGWKPKILTPTGKPMVDSHILETLDYPPIPLLLEYLLVEKRIGAVAEGTHAWLKCEKAGRIHGYVNTNGAVTGRMTHSFPNMAQIPSCDSPYGKECRSLFRASPSYVLVGCDAAALELRCLAGYMAPYDNGAYIKTVVEGERDSNTDIHTVNQQAIGAATRDMAKTWFYAYIYGAGHQKLGEILGGSSSLGKSSKERFEKGLPALGKLVRAIEASLQKRGYLKGLDGRKLTVRSQHAALNTLLQSAGAVLMKKALVILNDTLTAQGFVQSQEYAFVANVHDEWQMEVSPHLAEDLGRLAVESIQKAGKAFNFACPLDANYRIGTTWADTH